MCIPTPLQTPQSILGTLGAPRLPTWRRARSQVWPFARSPLPTTWATCKPAYCRHAHVIPTLLSLSLCSIPGPVIHHFLNEYREFKTYRGVPCCGFVTQDMENPAQRSWLLVPEGKTGVMVVEVDPLSRAFGVVRERDVILEVQGHLVADDGTATFREDERIEYVHFIRSMHVGEMLSLKVLREGHEMDLTYELGLKDHLVPMLHAVDCLPSYFIVGGLVFVPLSQPFLEAMYGGGRKTNRRSDIPSAVITLINENKKSKDQQVVILLQVLAHEINHGYKEMVVPCLSFNREPVKNLQSLASMVDKCITDDCKYLNFGLEGGRVITLDREQVELHQQTILKLNYISKDRSEDISQVISSSNGKV